MKPKKQSKTIENKVEKLKKNDISDKFIIAEMVEKRNNQKLAHNHDRMDKYLPNYGNESKDV